MGGVAYRSGTLDAMVSSSGEEPEKVRPLQSGEMLMLNSATATSVGTVSQ